MSIWVTKEHLSNGKVSQQKPIQQLLQYLMAQIM